MKIVRHKASSLNDTWMFQSYLRIFENLGIVKNNATISYCLFLGLKRMHSKFRFIIWFEINSKLPYPTTIDFSFKSSFILFINSGGTVELATHAFCKLLRSNLFFSVLLKISIF